MTEISPSKGTTPPAGAFAPLRRRLFAVLWIATILGNVGTFIRDVASAWLVMEISGSPAAVALVQAATTLPIFLFVILAGVVSDIVDRRKLLIAVQVGLAAVSATMAVVAGAGAATVPVIVGLSLIAGIGAALVMPTWQSIVPELVPRDEMKGAVALNSLGFNIARAIGPAIGGLVLATLGAASAYALDMFTYFVVIGALLWWRRAPTLDHALAEPLGGALRAGLRYARASRDLHRVLIRTGLFFAFASVIWALLPIVARDLLKGGPGLYGLLLAGVGAGAVVGAVLLPRLRSSLDADAVVLGSSLVTAAIAVGLAFAPPQWFAIAASLVLGVAWIGILTTLNSTAQAILPNWVRGRGLSIYLMVFNGAMSLGGIVWGALAEFVGVPLALMVGGAGLAIASIVAGRLKLPAGEADLSPSLHWPEPVVEQPVAHDRGPVMVTVEYRVPAADRPAFLDALIPVSEERRRDGAYAWGVTEDAADGERIVEWFFVESWAEHLRQHGRTSKADADRQAAAIRYHIGEEPPRVHHYLALTKGGPGLAARAENTR